MCGIAGFLLAEARLGAGALAAATAAMTDAIAHRGPDDAGVWTDAAAGVALGHRRLSILDLSAAGHQPMLSADGRFVLSFNGEIYNFQELRAELEGKGHRFRGHSDTEVLLAGIGEWGVEATLRRCNGMLAFALWDAEARTLTLARDRLGKKPLYYGCFAGSWLFGSELKALMAHPAFRRSIDRDALATYLRFDYLPAPWCIFQGVRKLPPASFVVLHAGLGADAAPPTAYWSARQAAEDGARQPFSGSFEEATDALAGLLADAVGKRMIADVSLGALLSGGIDSTTVVALMQAATRRPVKTFCIGFHEAAMNEAEHAAAIARHLGTDHAELYLSAADALALVPRLPEIYDEPFADPSQLPTLLVSQLARQQVTVAVTGDGGDEMFAGYAAYPRCLQQWRRWRRIPARVRDGIAGAAGAAAAIPWLADGRSRGAAARRLRKLAGKLAGRTARLRGATPVAMLAGKRTACEWPQLLVPGAHLLPTVLTDPARAAAVADPLLAMQQVDIEGYLTDDVLVKVDRASMAVALEVRSPLLDWRITEFALSLPAAMKLAPDGTGKRVLRAVLARHVPQALWDRPKAGFSVPIEAWLRGPLRDWAETLLEERLLQQGGLLAPAPVRRLWAQHQAGTHNHERVLWSLLIFQAWLLRWR